MRRRSNAKDKITGAPNPEMNTPQYRSCGKLTPAMWLLLSPFNEPSK